MTALCSYSGVPDTIAGVGDVENHGVAGEREAWDIVGRQMGEERASCELESTSTSAVGRLKSGEWSQDVWRADAGLWL